MSVSISVVVMAFNERRTIAQFVEETDSVLNGLKQPYEIIVVDDGSTDGSGMIAEEIGRARNNVRVVHHGLNRGLGEVYRTGFREAKGDYITFFSADGQFPPDIIGRFLPLMAHSDMVLGYLPKRDRPFISKSLSFAEKMLYSLLFGRLPKFQGIMMFRRSLLNQIEFTSAGRGWAIVMELIIKTTRSGGKIQSVPTEMRPRSTGRSKVNNVRTIVANLRQMMELRMSL